MEGYESLSIERLIGDFIGFYGRSALSLLDDYLDNLDVQLAWQSCTMSFAR